MIWCCDSGIANATIVDATVDFATASAMLIAPIRDASIRTIVGFIAWMRNTVFSVLVPLPQMQKPSTSVRSTPTASARIRVSVATKTEYKMSRVRLLATVGLLTRPGSFEQSGATEMHDPRTVRDYTRFTPFVQSGVLSNV